MADGEWFEDAAAERLWDSSPQTAESAIDGMLNARIARRARQQTAFVAGIPEGARASPRHSGVASGV